MCGSNYNNFPERHLYYCKWRPSDSSEAASFSLELVSFALVLESFFLFFFFFLGACGFVFFLFFFKGKEVMGRESRRRY